MKIFLTRILVVCFLLFTVSCGFLKESGLQVEESTGRATVQMKTSQLTITLPGVENWESIITPPDTTTAGFTDASLQTVTFTYPGGQNPDFEIKITLIHGVQYPGHPVDILALYRPRHVPGVRPVQSREYRRIGQIEWVVFPEQSSEDGAQIWQYGTLVDASLVLVTFIQYRSMSQQNLSIDDFLAGITFPRGANTTVRYFTVHDSLMDRFIHLEFDGTEELYGSLQREWFYNPFDALYIGIPMRWAGDSSRADTYLGHLNEIYRQTGHSSPFAFIFPRYQDSRSSMPYVHYRDWIDYQQTGQINQLQDRFYPPDFRMGGK